MDDPHHTSFLTKGSQVEVTSHEEGPNPTWYVATVLHPPPSTNINKLVYVEYHNLLSEHGRLREYANISYVRPSPLPDTNPPNFQLNDVVDAFYGDGWCTGFITALVDNDNFVVTFQNPEPDQVRFHCSQLRIHRRWVGGRWFQPQKQGAAGLMFTVGKKVEVCFERESLRYCWVPATILKNSDNNTFLVEYQQPGNGDEAILHKVTVDYLHIRPSPPHLRDKNFVLFEKVDAYYGFGWWSGVITKQLAGNRYIVYFKHTKKEREFIYSRVRPHMEWKGGKWFNASQGDLDGRTTPSLIDGQIEQTTPSIDKQSTFATSIMNRTKQKNLDINGKVSPSSKKLQDEIVNDDPSKKTNGPSEGLNSEVTGRTDQAYGKKVSRKLTDSSRKRGRPSNKLRNLQASDKGTQEIVGKEDITNDSPIPVVLGLQCNEMTVSQGKMLQKLSIEQTPNVTESDTQQPVVPFSPLTVVEKKGSEGDSEFVAPKRKRGRPPKLRALSPETSVTDNNQIGSVPSAPSVVEGGQKKEVGLTTSFVTKALEENHGPVKEQLGLQNGPLSKDKLANENTGQDLDVETGRGTKKFTAKKKRGKRRTISVNTESPAQDSQNASKEKTARWLEKDSGTRTLEASVGKSLDAMSDDQPLSRWVKANDNPITINGPEGTVEQSSNASEKFAICVVGSEDLPFVRNMSLWKTIESMDAFRMLPQKPHFRPLLEGVKESAREGLAIGTMVTFSTVVDKTCGMRFDEPRSTIEDCLETLVELENNGFDVEVIRERLTRLLLIKDKQDELTERSKGVAEKIEEHTVQRKRQCDDEINAINRQIRELQENRKQVVLKKEKLNSEIGVMEAMTEEIVQEMREVGAEFDVLAATPL